MNYEIQLPSPILRSHFLCSAWANYQTNVSTRIAPGLCRNFSTEDICNTLLARFLYLTILGTKQGAEECTRCDRSERSGRQ